MGFSLERGSRPRGEMKRAGGVGGGGGVGADCRAVLVFVLGLL